ncbi:MAG: hypothetical protein EAZ95_18780, partial [Bacteroidetes bacterium]
PSLNHYQRAEIYANRNQDKQYKDKYLDYATAGNYLRKSIEEFLKGYLFGKYRLKVKDLEVEFRKELGELWESFEKQMTALGFSMATFSDFGILSKTIFNPLSHDNLDKPIYKTELDTAFQFVRELLNLSKQLLLAKNTVLHLDLQNGTSTRRYIIKADEDIFMYKQNGVKKTNVELAEFYSKKYIEVGNAQSFSKQEGTLAKLYDKAVHSISGTLNASLGKNMLLEYKNTSGATLQSLIDSL